MYISFVPLHPPPPFFLPFSLSVSFSVISCAFLLSPYINTFFLLLLPPSLRFPIQTDVILFISPFDCHALINVHASSGANRRVAGQIFTTDNDQINTAVDKSKGEHPVNPPLFLMDAVDLDDWRPMLSPNGTNETLFQNDTIEENGKLLNTSSLDIKDPTTGNVMMKKDYRRTLFSVGIVLLVAITFSAVAYT